jgi:hypothetical protein
VVAMKTKKNEDMLDQQAYMTKYKREDGEAVNSIGIRLQHKAINNIKMDRYEMVSIREMEHFEATSTLELEL